MNILHIEDDTAFIAKLASLAPAMGHALVTLEDIGVARDKPMPPDGPIEDQLQIAIDQADRKTPVDLVLLDTDLSTLRNGISQSACRAALQILGIPVCRYSRRQSETRLSSARRIARIASEGASSIFVPADIISGTPEEILKWVERMHRGFSDLRREIPSLNPHEQYGAAALLADALKRPDTKFDLLGYTSQNLFFFGETLRDLSGNSPRENDRRRIATQLGYWLYNLVLTFPGPILNKSAAAALLNLKTSALDISEVATRIASARYDGPFSALGPYYWCSDLQEKMLDWSTPIYELPSVRHLVLDNALQTVSSHGFYCVLSGEPIKAEDAAAAPDWIPSGAQMSRVERKLYEQLGPLLSI